MLESRDSSPNWHTEMFTSQLGMHCGEEKREDGKGWAM
jgi:hypothetical protein